MFACDEYPTIVPSDGKHLIYVEVFEVDDATLARLNRLEEPYNYRRETIYVRELGREVEIYVYAERSPPAHFRPVVSGNWDVE